MLKKLFLVILCTMGFHAAFSQDLTADGIVKFLQKHSVIHEANPIHGGETSEINDLFSAVLLNRNTYSPEQRDNLRIQIFRILYENAICSYEDSSDARRRETRRMVLNMTLALLSPEYDRYSYFLQCAEMNLYYHPFERNPGYVLINLVKILILIDTGTNVYNHQQQIIRESGELSEYIRSNEFPEDFLNDLSEILSF